MSDKESEDKDLLNVPKFIAKARFTAFARQMEDWFIGCKNAEEVSKKLTYMCDTHILHWIKVYRINGVELDHEEKFVGEEEIVVNVPRPETFLTKQNPENEPTTTENEGSGESEDNKLKGDDEET
jgi:hypothetical protein